MQTITGDDPLLPPCSLSIATELHNGGTASFHHTDKVAGPGSTVEIYGTHGALDYKLLIEKAGGEVTQEELYGRTEGETELHQIEIAPEEQRDRTMDVESIEAIRNGTPVSPDFAEGIRYIEFCEAVAQSVHEGHTIQVPPEPKMHTWGKPF